MRHKEQEHGHNALNPYKPPLTVASGSSAANDHLNDCQSPCYIRRGLAPQANNLQLHVDKLEVLVAPCYVAFGQQRQFCYSWSPLANVSQFCTPLLRCDSFVLVLRLSNYFNILSTSIKSVFQITSTYYQRGIKSVFKLLRHVINVGIKSIFQVTFNMLSTKHPVKRRLPKLLRNDVNVASKASSSHFGMLST